MAAPLDASWSRTSGSDDALNKTTYGQGTSFPSTWPTTRLFWRTDLQEVYYNSGTEGSPVWTAITRKFSSELNDTPITDGASATFGTSLKGGTPLTLPSTYNAYIITGIEWKNGATVAGNMVVGAYKIDASPPVNTTAQLVALGKPVATVNINTIQRQSNIVNYGLCLAGDIILPWVNNDNASQTFRYLASQPSVNRDKAIAYTINPTLAENTAWSATTNYIYVKIYYKGIL